MEPKPNIVDPIKFAEWLVLHFNLQGGFISPMKLQKLMYYCQAWHLVFMDGHPLFDIQPEAWSNGPVYRPVYDIYKASHLRHQCIEIEGPIEAFYAKATEQLRLTEEQKNLIEAVIVKYGAFTQDQLVLFTHSDLPWNEAREGCEPFSLCTIPISLETMRRYYSLKVRKS
jgi:uncharacterized phage-associated protein